LGIDGLNGLPKALSTSEAAVLLQRERDDGRQSRQLRSASDPDSFGSRVQRQSCYDVSAACFEGGNLLAVIILGTFCSQTLVEFVGIAFRPDASTDDCF
jgi:hypothetical protein